MSDKHFTIEEMTKLIYADTLDDELVALAAAVNRHILECDRCRDCYQELLSVKEAVENVRLNAAHNAAEHRLPESSAAEPLSSLGRRTKPGRNHIKN